MIVLLFRQTIPKVLCLVVSTNHSESPVETTKMAKQQKDFCFAEFCP